ncbi:MAG: BatD family protein, partial [Prevotellaceae bacterium]|nr:BatD family protein [Prevotellaceae bacterium]
MKKQLLFILLMVSLAAGRAAAQSVTVDATIDSLQASQILIGEQAKIRLHVSLDADRIAGFPQYADTLVRGVEIVERSRMDTTYLNNRKRMELMQEYTVTSFDSALYYLPPMVVRVDSQDYRSNALSLKVLTVPIDTTQTVFPTRMVIMAPPFVWSDWYELLAFLVSHILLSFLFIYLIKRIMDNKPIIRKVKVTPKLPPHQLAMKEIERIKSEKSWQKEEPKAYYTELTDALRTYIRDRFGFNALEMTSAEIIEQLQTKEPEALQELRELFLTADLVKFAKHRPMLNENDANLVNAIDFINRNKEVADENAVPQPTEITIVEKRTLRSKIVLGAAIGLIGIWLFISML